MNGVLLSLLLLLLSMVRLNAAPGDTITVLVAYTIPAEENFNLYDQHCNTTIFPGAQAAIIPPIYGSINALIDACMADLNATVQNTKITNPATGRTPFFRLVCRMRTVTNVDASITNSYTMGVFLSRLQSTSEPEGWFVDIDNARNLHRADIVQLLFYAAAPHSGLASGTEACITLVNDAAFGCFTHEIGHLLGAGPGDSQGYARGLWGIHPDAGISRSTNATWHTQSNNIVPEIFNYSTGAQAAYNPVPGASPPGTGLAGHIATLLYNPNGITAEGIFHYYKTNETIPVWSTTDPTVFWRGIQVASANRAPQNDAGVIRGNLVTVSNQRVVGTTEALENITITSERLGVIEASSSITLNPGTTINEGADIQMAIVSAPAPKAVKNNRANEIEFITDTPSMNATPNPFNSTTQFSFIVPQVEGEAANLRVSLSVFAPNGQLIRTLVDGVLLSGKHGCFWDGKDGFGNTVSTGLYIARIKMDRKIIMRNLIFVK